MLKKLSVRIATMIHLLNHRNTMCVKIAVVSYIELNIKSIIWDQNSINKNQNHIKLINKKSIFYNKLTNGIFNLITMILNLILSTSFNKNRNNYINQIKPLKFQSIIKSCFIRFQMIYD